MSPKQITRLALVVAVISILGLILSFLPGSRLGWWPVLGLGLSLLLMGIAFLRGVYLTAQQRVRMVDMLNDCYAGVTPAEQEMER
uniref:Uncharacterized protein n=1 Tax=uncultured Chloroflexota bacterium TaxID=166587 RepID=H5SPB9_9CHLR|nr:hypothetical protein HGMM_F53H06C02 [uncultured Chloroflexota bacterium]